MNAVGRCKYLKQAQLLILVTGHGKIIFATFTKMYENISRKSSFFFEEMFRCIAAFSSNAILDNKLRKY
jgi:hypothetical protein